MEAKEKLTYSVEETAERLGIAPNTVRRMLKKGQLPSIKAGDRWLIPVAALTKLLETAGAKCS